MDGPSDVQILHWLPNEDRWAPIAWKDWVAFRGFRDPSVGMPGITAGVHHFVAAVKDDDGTIVNLIPHKYLIEPSGKLGADNFTGLTREERDDYDRLMVEREETPEGKQRLEAIRTKMGKCYYPPRDSIAALRWELPNRPPVGSAAHEFLESFRSPS